MAIIHPARTYAPLPVCLGAAQPAVERALQDRLVLVRAPPGFLAEEHLAALLAERHGALIWLRAEPDDDDPASLLWSLIVAARRAIPQAGASTVERLRRRAGQIGGWAELFQGLAADLAAGLQQPTAVVIARPHQAASSPAPALLTRHFIANLPATTTCVLLGAWPSPAGAAQLSAADLALEAGDLPAEPALPPMLLGRARQLAAGRIEAMRALVEAMADDAGAQRIVRRAPLLGSALASLAGERLACEGACAWRQLHVALATGYLHADLVDEPIVEAPWLQPLAGGWMALRAIWRGALGDLAAPRTRERHAALAHAAAALAAQGQAEPATTIYLGLREHAIAGDMVAAQAEHLLNLGRAATLRGWVDQLPASQIARHPWLAYAMGELTAESDLPGAARLVAAAGSHFRARGDAEGVCQSLLAESALAAAQAAQPRALAAALAAADHAATAGLAWYQLWGAWQVACLRLAADEVDEAQGSFERAAAAARQIGDRPLAELVADAAHLALRWAELRRLRDQHQRAYIEAAQAERAVGLQLQELLQALPDGLDGVLGAYGWARTPLTLKLTAPAQAAPQPGRWAMLRRALGLWHRLRAVSAADAPPEPQAGLAVGVAVRDLLAIELPAPQAVSEAAAASPTARARAVGEAEPAPAAGRPETLTTYLLGPFRVLLDDRPIESWPSNRGRAVLKYLLAHRGRPIPREAIMEAFWPEASPESARNSLNVALHGLRQAARAVSAAPVVIYADGAYQINPELDVWVDRDAFERHSADARQLEARGDLAAAAAEYGLAIELYQGDFLADDLSEEWAVLPREQLRVAYLDALDRLGQIALGQGDYHACIQLGQRLLASDACREDVHRRLMRCYSSQGQRHLALRQYQQCADALRAELGIAPDDDTEALAAQIRRGNGG